MNEHNQEENQLSKKHHQLDVFLHIHALNDSAQSGNPDELKQTEERQNSTLRFGY